MLCSPALIYLIFSSTQIIIDFYKVDIDQAVIKIISTIFVTILLNILCKRGLSIISWLIVFIPFLLMFIVVIMLLYAGINVKKEQVTKDKQGNIIIYNPNYTLLNPPFYYQYPNLIVTNPNKPISINTFHPSLPPPTSTSSPEYQS
jgi:hypothetical protein